jgi:hypothetical protein
MYVLQCSILSHAWQACTYITLVHSQPLDSILKNNTVLIASRTNDLVRLLKGWICISLEADTSTSNQFVR